MPQNKNSRQGAVIVIFLLVLVALMAAVAGYFQANGPRQQQPEVVLPRAASDDSQPQERPGAQPAEPALEERRPVVQPPLSRSYKRGTMAIIIDDMGDSTTKAQALFELDAAVTVAIIPGTANDRETALLAEDSGTAAMIHIPMEPRGWPRVRMEKSGLFMTMSEDEISAKVAAMIKQLPGISGANNHMGSRLTESAAHMMAVMRPLKEAGLFFVDSRTSADSVAGRVARASGLRAAGRDIFLDNTATVAAVTAQLLKAADLAEKRGSVVVIGHPHKETIAALQQTLPQLRQAGIKFVSADNLAE